MMIEINVFISIIVVALCSGFAAPLNNDMTPYPDTKRGFDLKVGKISNEDKDSRKSINQLEANNRALGSILFGSNNEGNRKILEDLIKNTNLKVKPEDFFKKADEVVFTNTFLDDPNDNNRNVDSGKEQYEMVIERVDDDDKSGEKHEDVSLREAQEDEAIENYESPDNYRRNHGSGTTEMEQINRDTIERKAVDSFLKSAEFDEEPSRTFTPEPVLIGDVMLPNFRTTISRTGLVTGPTLYTVQAATPADLVNPKWMPNLGATFRRSGLPDDGSNSYLFAAPKVLPDTLASKMADVSIPAVSNLYPYRDVYLPNQRYFPETYRRVVRIQT